MEEERDAGLSGSRPEGSPETPGNCEVHRDRFAIARCSNCGLRACFACWHQPVERCHACVIREPAALSPPIPWEQEGVFVVRRFFGTLLSVFRPYRWAPAFAQSDSLAPSVRFLLLSFFPFAVLSQFIPLTHTLLFHGMKVRIQGTPTPTQTDILIDCIRAMGLGLGLSLLQLVAIALPYASLAVAYGEPTRRNAAVRGVLYRAWIVPFVWVLLSLAGWIAHDEQSTQLVGGIVSMIGMLFLFLFFVGLRATARMSCGAGPLASWLPIVVAIILHAYSVRLANWAIEPLIPIPPPKPATSAPTEPRAQHSVRAGSLCEIDLVTDRLLRSAQA